MQLHCTVNFAGRLQTVRIAASGLHLFGLTETVREVFDISGFSQILAVFAAEAEALKGF